MTDDGFQAGSIDHVELIVPDRYEAADWYRDALGLEIVEEFEHWADRSGYPLMISSDSGDTMLALFKGTPSDGNGGFQRVAFKMTGENFLQFRDRLEEIPNIDQAEHRNVADFDSAYSVFLSDPYGHSLEVTTYDYEFVSEILYRS